MNYDKQNGKYVRCQWERGSDQAAVIRYTVVDQLGNEATLDREVRIVDTTAPVITLNDDGGINFLNIKTGHPFVDPGAVARDNYDSSPTVVKSIQSIVSGQVLSDPAGGEIFQTSGKYRFLGGGKLQSCLSIHRFQREHGKQGKKLGRSGYCSSGYGCHYPPISSQSIDFSDFLSRFHKDNHRSFLHCQPKFPRA